jgi:hypothetical protein
VPDGVEGKPTIDVTIVAMLGGVEGRTTIDVLDGEADMRTYNILTP